MVHIQNFLDFISDLVLHTDMASIVGDFNIHVDRDVLSSSFTPLVDSVGFSQHVEGPINRCNHMLDY